MNPEKFYNEHFKNHTIPKNIKEELNKTKREYDNLKYYYYQNRTIKYDEFFNVSLILLSKIDFMESHLKD